MTALGLGACKRIVAAVLVCAGALLWHPSSRAGEEPVLLDVKRFIVEGDNPLSADETDGVLKAYLGPHTTLERLEAAASELQQAIRRKGYSFHRVIIPAQQPAGGELKLRVLAFVLGDVHVAGNRHFSSENVRRSVPGLKPGKPPNLPQLSQEVSLANEHPSKRLFVQMKEGAKEDTVDAEIRVTDAPPPQFFAGLVAGTRDTDNSLNRNTGYTRLTFGYQHSNLFDRDQTLTLAYTTSPDHLSDVRQYGVFYTIPLYGYDTMLTAYWSYSDIDSGTIGIGSQSFGVTGGGRFYGIRATYALPKIGDVSHNVALAWDSRYFESDISFEGTPLPASAVGSRPVSLRYSVRAERGQNSLVAFAEYAVNTTGGRSNDDFAYAQARAGAKQDWDAARIGVDGTYTPRTGWSLNARWRYQYSDEPLIPGEQLGIAGVGGVRGFRDREFAGDKGYFVNLEAHAPAWTAGLTPFVFYDQGSRRQVLEVAGASSREFISSAGAGLRWQGKRLDVSLAWAHVLEGAFGGTPDGHNKLLFSAFYRF
ncbi:MAG: ShlB/FhaC/HecB family hemolysin secretion/activation protein [Burkholderiales bacterium]